MKTPDFLRRTSKDVDQALARFLELRRACTPPKLWAAMRYSLLAGGKRIRPALLIASHRACGGQGNVMPAAAALECIHTYSLIHDDLPCMDNDDLRRGKPTCHRQFDEATAVLAGDALQALGFELLSETQAPAALCVSLLHKLAHACGAQGMVGGQMLDMEAEKTAVHNEVEVERIHVHKTGALILFACEAGAMLAGAEEHALRACSRYGKAVGLLFQIADDILDATASTEAMGKATAKDDARQKATYVSVLGLERSIQLANEMLDLALQAIEPLGEKGKHLAEIVRYVRYRQR